MSRFNITAPDGRIVVVEGDEEPTDEEAEEIFESLPKLRAKKETSGFDPSVQRSLVSVLKGLEKRLESAAAKPDIKVDVAAPNVKVEAPEVEVSVPKTPRKWKIRITERDDDNRIKEMTIDAVD